MNRKSWAALAVGVVMIGLLGACLRKAQTNPLLVRMFGPPSQTLVEAYAQDAGTATVDHSGFDALLRAHVKGTRVDYDGFAADRAALDAYLQVLATAPFAELDRDEKLALLINAYNAFTVALILDHAPVDSIKDIPSADRWDAKRWTLGGRTMSLSEIEHEELRAKFIEPRIHFAINCASVGCPPLRAEAFVPAKLDAQLEAQAVQMHTDGPWLAVGDGVVQLTPLYLWYAGDFEQVGGSQLGYAARYRPELGEGEWSIQWIDYDWALNQAQE